MAVRSCLLWLVCGWVIIQNLAHGASSASSKSLTSRRSKERQRVICVIGIHFIQNRGFYGSNVMTSFFSYNLSLLTSIYRLPRTALLGSRIRVVFWSFSSQFRVDLESRLEIDSKTTDSDRKMTRIRLPGRGGGVPSIAA